MVRMVCAHKLLIVRKKILNYFYILDLRFIWNLTCALFQKQRNRVASNKPKNKK